LQLPAGRSRRNVQRPPCGRRNILHHMEMRRLFECAPAAAPMLARTLPYSASW